MLENGSGIMQYIELSLWNFIFSNDYFLLPPLAKSIGAVAAGDNSMLYMYCMIPDPFSSSAFGKGSDKLQRLGARFDKSFQAHTMFIYAQTTSSNFTTMLAWLINLVAYATQWGFYSPFTPFALL